MTQPTPGAGVGTPLIGPPETMLEVGDTATVASALAAGEDAAALAARYPATSLAWAVLAEDALAAGPGTQESIAAYAFARTGYHRGLDALRRSGWRGAGPVPWRHEPNQGFLRALRALALAAGRIGEEDEATRCRDFLAACDPSVPLTTD